MRIESLHDALAIFPDIDGFWRPNSWPESEALIRSKLPANWETEWDPSFAEILTQLARAQGLQGNLSEAQQTLARIIKKEPRVELRCLLEQGRLFCLSMSPKKAHDFFAQAWMQANETEQAFFAIDAALMLSTIRPPKYQNEWLQLALNLAETSDDETARLWLPQLYLLDGWHAFDFRQFEKALVSFEKALVQPQVQQSEEKAFPMLWAKARVLRALGRVPDALAIQEGLMRRMQMVNGKVNGHVYLEIAENQQLLKSQDEAKANFELAYAELSANGWYSDNKTAELSRMKDIFKKR